MLKVQTDVIFTWYLQNSEYNEAMDPACVCQDMHSLDKAELLTAVETNDL
jgi:hypothetical protein